MKKVIIFCSFFTLIISVKSSAAIKEVKFDWNSPSISWEDRVGYLPCKEPFNIRIVNAPEHTVRVLVKIYNSSGNTGESLAGQIGSNYETNVSSSNSNDIIIFIPQKLTFHRFYYIEVELTTSTSNTTVTSPNTTASAPNLTTTVTTPRANVTVTTTVNSSTVTTTAAAESTETTSTITTTTTVSTTETKRTDKTYTVPLRSEISKIQFLGSLGDVMFVQNDFKNLNHNVALTTGLKLKFYPVSTNPNIGRFGLYPWKSRWSLVIGTVLSELSYKTTEIKSLGIGLKLAGGLDFEFTENIGISIAGVVGKQDTKSKLTSSQKTVVGFSVGLSFSTAIFQAVNKAFPVAETAPTQD